MIMVLQLHRGKKSFLGEGWGYTQMVTILHRGVGVSGDPQKWLRNMCRTPHNIHMLLIQYTQYNLYHIIKSTNRDEEWVLSFSYHHHISWGVTLYLFQTIIPAKSEISYVLGIIISAKRDIENYLIFLILSYKQKGIQRDIFSFYASWYQTNSDKSI